MLGGKIRGAFLHVPHFPSSHSAGGLSPPGLTSALLSESVTPPAPPCDQQGQRLIGVVATCPRSHSVALTRPPGPAEVCRSRWCPPPPTRSPRVGRAEVTATTGWAVGQSRWHVPCEWWEPRKSELCSSFGGTGHWVLFQSWSWRPEARADLGHVQTQRTDNKSGCC